MKSDTISPSISELIQKVELLSITELNNFANEVAALRARRIAPMLTATESTLFTIINQSLPTVERERLIKLGEKRADETLSSDEQKELLVLQQKLEAMHSARIKALAELAELRGLSITTLMDQLGIQFSGQPEEHL